MGPRPFGRGREVIWFFVMVGVRLQWGRDLSVAEGPAAGKSTPVPGPRFNGAATFRSRKVVWRVLATPHDLALQWGRDLSVAEGFQPSGLSWWHDTLQWGRDLSVAEGCRTRRTARPCSGFNGAATFRSRKDYGSVVGGVGHPSFNGAATFRSRKVTLLVIAAGLFLVLQWGRDLSVAEGRGPRRQRRRGPQASMGPRPFGRGRHTPGRLSSTAPRQLQWGRDLSVAEGARTTLPWEPTEVLQWGRDLSVAEGWLKSRVVPPTCLLQWGRDLSVAEGRHEA